MAKNKHGGPGRNQGRKTNAAKGIRSTIKKHISFDPSVYDRLTAEEKEGEGLSGVVNRLLEESKTMMTRELTQEQMEQHPAGTKAGKNVWQDEVGNRIKCEPNDRPMGVLLFPCYPESRVNGHTYTPYGGADDWSQAANQAMSETAQYNFQNSQN